MCMCFVSIPMDNIMWIGNWLFSTHTPFHEKRTDFSNKEYRNRFLHQSNIFSSAIFKMSDKDKLPSFYKHPSGAEKRKKKKLENEQSSKLAKQSESFFSRFKIQVL